MSTTTKTTTAGMSIWDALDPRHAGGGHLADHFSRVLATFDGSKTVRVWRDIDGRFYIAEQYDVEWDGETVSALMSAMREILDRYICRVVKDDA